MTSEREPASAFAGLCASCRHRRVVENRRGSRFYMCERSRTDDRFRKYPPLPVLRCSGYQPEAEAERDA